MSENPEKRPETFSMCATSVQAFQFTDETKDKVATWAYQIQSNISCDVDINDNPVIIIPNIDNYDDEITCYLGDYLIKLDFPINKRLGVMSAKDFSEMYNTDFKSEDGIYVGRFKKIPVKKD